MNDQDALLAVIAANPEEDTPRLMLADWLDEHGRHIQAEFIRVQIEIARKEHLPRPILNRYVDLFKRNQELLDDHRAELLGNLKGLAADTRIEFRRGFISWMELPVDRFLMHAEELTRIRPRPAIRVTRAAARALDFIRSPYLELVTDLSIYSALGEIDIRRPEEGEVVRGANRLSRLASLDLEGCELSDAVIDLLANVHLPALVELDLSQNAMTDAGVSRFLRTSFPPQLTRLVLGGNAISDAGAIALAHGWPTGTDDRLENLNLRFTNIGQAGQSVLLRRFGGRVDLF